MGRFWLLCGPALLAAGFFTSNPIEPAAAQDKELRNRIQQVENSFGGRTYTDSFIPKEAQDKLSVRERKEYEQLKALRRLLEERSKQRKK